MKKLFLLFIFISAFTSCKFNEGYRQEEPNLRADGVYVAEKINSQVGNAHGIQGNLKALSILRFNTNQTGVIVPYSIDRSIADYNDSLIKEFWFWTTEFEKRNPQDKGFCHFKYQQNEDSIGFEQIKPEVIFSYSGKITSESIIIALKYLPTEMSFTQGQPHILKYKFYPLNK